MTFPNDITNTLKTYVETLPAVTVAGIDYSLDEVRLREPRANDSNCSAYIFATRHGEIDHCIGHTFPNRSFYDVEIVLFMKMRDEEECLEVVSALTDNLRSLIYGDVALRNDLNALSYASGGAQHTVSKFKVTGQRYVTPATEGVFVSMSMTSLRFDVTSTS